MKVKVNPKPSSDPIEIAKALLEMQKSLEKSNVKGRSIYPYYTEQHAQEMAKILEHVTTTGHPKDLYASNNSAATVKQKVYQAIKYLVEHLDPDGNYARMRSLCIISNTSRGVRIQPRPEKGLLSETFNDTEWKEKLLDFLTIAKPKQKIEWIGLPLTSADVKWAQDKIRPHEQHFVADVNLTQIIIVRLPEFQAEPIKAPKVDEEPDLV